MALATLVTIRKRVACVLLITSCLMLALTWRLAYLQFFRGRWLAENAVDQRVRNIPVEARRGIIYDRKGEKLAVSANSASVYAIPAEINSSQEPAAKLAAILALDPQKLSQKLQQRQAFIWIKRKVTADEAAQVAAINLAGIGLTQEGKRYYPQGNLAAHILGFTGIDSQGLDGVEMTFDQYLRGKPGRIVVEYDASGREIPSASHQFIEPLDGNSVYLTIDAVIQRIVERELDKAMQETRAKAGTVIAMDPASGGILALANRPDYDPNHFADSAPRNWRNIAVSNAYEPGSTFKIVTAAAALADRVVSLQDRFYDPGYIEVQDRRIRCWKAGGHGSETFVDVVKNSCNVGFVSIGLKLGRDAFYRYIMDFGLNRPTEVDLPGEAKGILIPREKVKLINIATMAMGQGIAVTPMQLLTAVSAIANDGLLLRPQIVQEVRDGQGNVVRGFAPDVKKQVIDAKNAAELKGILEKVVEDGTGIGAYVAGYRIAGKTGTAQKAGSGGYQAGKYVASFVGFAPADQPRIVMLVLIDEPQGMYYGGQIAAPVFGAIIKDVLQYWNLQPEAAPVPGQQEIAHVLVPDVTYLSREKAQQELQAAGLSYHLTGSGAYIMEQMPAPGSRVPPGTRVILYDHCTEEKTGREITVPNLQSLPSREAEQALTSLELLGQVIGQGQVYRQDPPAGSMVEAGTTVTLYCGDGQE